MEKLEKWVNLVGISVEALCYACVAYTLLRHTITLTLLISVGLGKAETLTLDDAAISETCASCRSYTVDKIKYLSMDALTVDLDFLERFTLVTWTTRVVVDYDEVRVSLIGGFTSRHHTRLDLSHFTVFG